MSRPVKYLKEEIESQRSLIAYHKEKEKAYECEIERKKQSLKEAQEALDKAEKDLGFHFSWLHVQRDKLARLYQEYYEAISNDASHSV